MFKAPPLQAGWWGGGEAIPWESEINLEKSMFLNLWRYSGFNHVIDVNNVILVQFMLTLGGQIPQIIQVFLLLTLNKWILAGF